MKLFRAILILLVSTLYGSMANAQGWEKVIDLGGVESGTSVLPANGGGYFVGGSTEPNASTFIYNPFVFKIDESGQRLWTTQLHTLATANMLDMVKTSTGDLLICGTYTNNDDKQMFVAKLSAAGDSLWFRTYSKTDISLNASSLVETTNGDILVAVEYYDSLINTTGTVTSYLLLNSVGDSLSMKFNNLAFAIRSNKMVNTFDQKAVSVGYGNLGGTSAASLVKTDETGDTIWTKIFVNPNGTQYPWSVIQTHDSGFVYVGIVVDNLPHVGTDTTRIHSFISKTDKDGSALWSKTFIEPGFLTYSQSVIEDVDGNLIMCDHTENPDQHASYHFKPMFRMLDANGNEIRRKLYVGLPGVIAEMLDIAPTPTGGWLMVGGRGFYRTFNDVYLIKTDSVGNIYPGRVSGKVYHDANRSCVIDTLENGLGNWIVKAASGTREYYTASDTSGYYTIESDTGNYTLSIVDPTGYWTIDSTCTDSALVHVATAIDTVHRNISLSANRIAPYMQIQVSAAILRACLKGPAYYVDYSNTGTIPAVNSYADITLDPDMTLDSSTVAYTSLGNNIFRFQLGTVNVNQHGQFLMHLRANCGVTLGSTKCVLAHIYPDTSATVPLAIWDHSHLDVQSTCLTDSLQFRVINNGTGNMNSSVQYRIIQDDVLYASGNIRLNSGLQFTTRVPANGATWTFVTEQTVGHPGSNRPILSVEACGRNSQGNFSTGFALMFPLNDNEPFIDEFCQVVRASWDPNEKKAAPLGLGLAGSIDASQAITYTIGFQNTGNDTAFTVVLVDTLSPLLDLSTLNVIGSSHPYHYTLRNGVLEFVFYPIELPDSNINEPASHGFINFIIKPKPNLAPATRIENTAYIYFDANEPVLTNTTVNTIEELYKLWLTISETEDVNNSMNCYPNPNSGKLMLEYKGKNEEATFTIFDVLGKKVFEQRVTPGLQQLDISSIQTGIYLYKLTGKGETASGKITRF